MEDLTGKVTGDTLTADEWNQLPGEIQNIILAATGVGPLDSGNLNQLGEALAQFYGATGGFWIDTGPADAYVLNVIPGQQAPTTLSTGLRVVFRPGNANTGASTVNVASLGVKNILREDTTALATGDLAIGRDAIIRYDGTQWLLAFSSLLQGVPDFTTPAGYISGCITEQAVDGDHDITVNEGVARNTLPSGSGNTKTITVSSALTKQIDFTWAAGNNAGGRAAGVALSSSTWYHLFLLGTSGNGVFEFGFDTSPVGQNFIDDDPGAIRTWIDANGGGNLILRRIGAVQTDGSSNIFDYTQRQDQFIWTGTSARTQRYEVNPVVTTTTTEGPLRVPPGVEVEWNGIASFYAGTKNQHYRALFGPTAMGTLPLPTEFNADIDMFFGTGQFSKWTVQLQARIYTDTSGNILLRVDQTHANTDMRFMGWGWIDPRDKDVV